MKALTFDELLKLISTSIMESVSTEILNFFEAEIEESLEMIDGEWFLDHEPVDEDELISFIIESFEDGDMTTLSRISEEWTEIEIIDSSNSDCIKIK